VTKKSENGVALKISKWEEVDSNEILCPSANFQKLVQNSFPNIDVVLI
jgi:hypothetical protein